MTTSSASVRRVPRLPACRACHQRKVKCDNNRPKCAPCTRNGSACILIFPGTDYEPMSREELYELELREQTLAQASQPSSEKGGPDGPSTISWQETPPDTSTLPPPASVAAEKSGEKSNGGSSFMALLLKDREWRKSHAHLLQTLGRTTKVAETTEAQVEAHSMPSAEDVRYLFGRYLTGSHVQNPFLLRHEVQQLYVRIFAGDGVNGPGDVLNPADRAARRDVFRTFMILAVASIVPYRLGQHAQHPLGYYLAAMQHFSSDFLATSLDSVQDLLLICRFGIFYHIGTSIWDTIQLCGRLCIELGLHRPRDTPANMLQEQIERRVFWEYYMLDRYSSTTINRPFAISDGDITVPFPADADDGDILDAQAAATAASANGSNLLSPPPPHDLESFCKTHEPKGPTEMSVFLQCTRLRQISSRIQTEFSRLSTAGAMGTAPFLLTGRIYSLLDDILRDIDVWRQGAPVFSTPRSLYEMTEWYDLLLARERLHAIRRAMDLSPKHDDGSGGLPARHLLALCLDAATKTIRLYGGLFRSHVVTYTRSYFHTVFTAGLSVMFCCCASTPEAHWGTSQLSYGVDKDRDGFRLRDGDRDPIIERERIRESRDILVLCEETLAHMGAQLPDARGYVTAFAALHKSVSQKLDQALQAEGDARSPAAMPVPPTIPEIVPTITDASIANNNTGTLDIPSIAVQPTDPASTLMSVAATMTGGLGNSGTSNNGNVPMSPSGVPFFGRATAPLATPFNTGVVNTASSFGTHPHAHSLAPFVAPPVRNELLPWAFLNDDTMWNVVGEYVYGDPNETLGLFSGFDFNIP